MSYYKKMKLDLLLILKFIKNKIILNIKKIIQEYRLYKYSKKYNCNFGNDLNFLGPLENLKIGENTTVNSYANFRFSNGKINFGRDCLVGRNVTILTQSYNLDKQKKISLEEMLTSDVNIGDNVLLGSNIIIMPNVDIGNHAVVGAGSVVTKNIGDFEIWAGSPAKFIRKRKVNE